MTFVEARRARARMALAAACCAAALVAVPVLAQTPAVSPADIQRLQDNIYDTSRDVSAARSRDQALASQLETELDEAREEAIYLKVKLRKREPVTRGDYAELRDRIDNIRTRARGDAAAATTAPASAPARASAPATVPAPAAAPAQGTAAPPSAASVPAAGPTTPTGSIPVGTEMDVRLQTPLSSNTAKVEDRFEATTMVDVSEGSRVLVPAGSLLRGVVSSVTSAGRLERKGSMVLAFDQITVNGRTYPIRGTVTQALESEGVRGEAGKIGTAAGVGAIIGGILGGFKGALAGVLIGGGGVVAATEGTDVNLPAGAVLRLRLDQPLDIR